MAQSRRSTPAATKGVSLARGPALIIGTVLLAAGLYFLYRAHSFPALSRFGSGHAPIDVRAPFHIFGVNGWSAELTAVAGGVLLFCAAQHILAKTASLIVAIALGGVAIIALFDHHSALGLFAAGIWTMVLWGGSAVLLLINALLPRTAGISEPVAPEPVVVTPVPVAAVAPRPVPVPAAEPVTTQMPAEPVTTQMPAEPVTTQMPAEPVTTQMPAEPVTTQMPAEPVTTQMPAEPATAQLEPESTNEPVTTQLDPSGGGAQPTRTGSSTGSRTRMPMPGSTRSETGRPVRHSPSTGGSPTGMGPIRTEPVTGSSARATDPDSQ